MAHFSEMHVQYGIFVSRLKIGICNASAMQVQCSMVIRGDMRRGLQLIEVPEEVLIASAISGACLIAIR